MDLRNNGCESALLDMLNEIVNDDLFEDEYYLC